MLNSFPQGKADTDVLLRTFESVLAEYPTGHIVDAARRFTTGLVSGQHTEFAPSVASFTSEVRRLTEQQREVSRLRSLPPAAKPQWQPIAAMRERVEAEMRGRPVLASDMTVDGYLAAARAKTFPPGAVYVAITSKVYGPAIEASRQAA